MSTKTVSTGITRIELNQRKGYLVRLSRNGERINKYFSDSVNGGKKKALTLAKKTYQELFNQYGPVEYSTKGKMSSRNSTGVVGVHLAYSQDNRYPGCEYYAYCASWVDEDGRRMKASFAFTKYGEDAAFDLAVLARELENNDRDAVVAKYARTAKGKRTLNAAKNAAKKAAKKTSSKKTAAKKSTKKAVKKSTRKSVKKAAKKSVRKTVKKATGKKSVKKSAKKSTRSSTKKKATKKPAKKKAVKKKATKKTTRRR